MFQTWRAIYVVWIIADYANLVWLSGRYTNNGRLVIRKKLPGNDKHFNAYPHICSSDNNTSRSHQIHLSLFWIISIFINPTTLLVYMSLFISRFWLIGIVSIMET